ncbi:dialkylrecorsinol condensing enzyme [Aurantivibrio infirmus]
MTTNKKRILVIGYTQSGQLDRVIKSVSQPLLDSDAIELSYLTLEPAKPFPFPWPFLYFFNTFPDCVYEEPIELKPLNLESYDYDLIILAYQVWFLSPSLPISTFLNSPEAEKIFSGKPVITLIGCRNMWLMAQEKVKEKLAKLNARLIDNVVLTDEAHNAATFIATPLWVLTGNKGPWLGGVIPRAGISDNDILAAKRFGDAIAAKLPNTDSPSEPMLTGLGAVTINERMIASERVAHRSFRIWGKLLRATGDKESFLRKCVLVIYIIFLVTLILTVMPVLAILKRIFTPLTRKHTANQKAYYAGPSGEANCNNS